MISSCIYFPLNVMVCFSLWLCKFPLGICIVFYLAIHLGWLNLLDTVICEQIHKDVQVVHPCGRWSNLDLRVQTKNRTASMSSSMTATLTGVRWSLTCPWRLRCWPFVFLLWRPICQVQEVLLSLKMTILGTSSLGICLSQSTVIITVRLLGFMRWFWILHC